MLSHRRFLPLPFLLSLVGALFCAWNLWGESDTLCVTHGCRLFQNFAIAGISLWWVGLVGCAALLLAAVPGAVSAGLAMATVGLLLDTLLLVTMLVTAPCFPCLLIGLVLAGIFASYRTAARMARHDRRPARPSALLTAWALLFIANFGSLAHDAVDPWALAITGVEWGASSDDVAVRAYFSPTCPACVALVESLNGPESARQTGMTGAVAWYPVAESERDMLILANMQTRMAAGAKLPEALRLATEAAPVLSVADQLRPSMIMLQLRLWRNRARVLAAGSDYLPLVQFHGLPAALTHAGASPASEQPAPRADRLSVSSALSGADDQTAPDDTVLPFLDVAGFCGGEEPCDDANQTAP